MIVRVALSPYNSIFKLNNDDGDKKKKKWTRIGGSERLDGGESVGCSGFT